MPKNKLFLIDANSFCYRAYFAIKNLSTSYGQPTNAVYGFISMLKKILKNFEPQFLGICFDVKGQTFRQKKYTDYKINRPPMPDDLTSQMPLIKQAVLAYNLPIFEMEGFEADDIMATITQKLSGKETEVLIVSADKDILQLVNENVKAYNPLKEDIYDKDKVEKLFGVVPDKITDLLALAGDKADNIPGVVGIGEVTAKQLLKEFASLEDIFSNLEKIKSEKLRGLLKAQKEKAFLSKELAVLNKDVPFKIEFEKFRIGTPNTAQLFKLFKELEFNSLIRELPLVKTKGTKIKIETIDNPKEIKEFLNNISGQEEFAFVFENSCEVKEKNVTLFICLKAAEVVKIICKDLSILNALFQDNKILKIGYDIKKTFVSLLKETKVITRPLFDVMVAAYLINPSQTNYSLENLAWDYLEERFVFETLETERIVELIFRLKPILEVELKQRSLWELFLNVEMPLTLVLARMEFEGVTIDKAVLKKLSSDLGKRIDELILIIYKQAGVEFNINSPKQLSEILFIKLKLPILKKTKTGFSTDEEVLSKLALNHKVACDLLEYRQLVKLKSTYIDALPNLVDEKTQRLHTSFNQTGTETGRLSSSNPNLQNIPIKTETGRQIRKAFIPSKKDNFLVSADYSQIELRILAHLSQDENLIMAFREGKDIHRITAALIFNQQQEETTTQMRDTAKRINFGIIYGMSAYGLSKDLKISQESAQEFIDAYFMRYPRVKEFMESQIDKAKKEGFVTTLLGRRRYILQINSTNMNLRRFAERQAINTPVQGSASDLIKLAMINIQDELLNKRLGSRLTIQVHDELVFDSPSNELETIKRLIKDIMENVLRLSVPIVVSIKYGKNWLEQKEY
ncbi:MAG: DNA polymerase I [Candidatus Omnitrophota bacterium]|nr:DNA polymerase I [Candidatus Omnitrophota bacterium]